MNRIPGVFFQARQWFQRASLWRRLALLLLPCLLAMTSLELWMTRHDALEAADSAYDRSLLGALKSIDANISVASGGLAVELPHTMFEFFELTASGQVVLRVATSDGLVELGSADLPESTVPMSTRSSNQLLIKTVTLIDQHLKLTRKSLKRRCAMVELLPAGGVPGAT